MAPQLKLSSLITLLRNFKLTLFTRLMSVARGISERSDLASRLLKSLGVPPDMGPTGNLKKIVSGRIHQFEEAGLITVDRGMIHPSPEMSENPQAIEQSLFQSIKDIDGIELSEHTDVYLSRLRRSGGIFSWRNTIVYRLKIYLENMVFFWRSPLTKGYREASRLADRFLEWETTLEVRDSPEEITTFLEPHFKEVNQISSSTILQRTSFGQANQTPLGNQPVFIISDLHLSSGSKFDRFNKAAKLVRLLKIVQNLKATLIINGDFFDFWQAQAKIIFTRYKEILWELIRIKRVIMIVGNHDRWLENFNNQRFLMPNISIMTSYYDPGNRLYIEHGHRGDLVNNSPAGEIISRLVTTAELIPRVHLAEPLERIARKIVPEKMWFEQQIASYVKRMSTIYYDELGLGQQSEHGEPLRIVFGHIHYPESQRTIDEIGLLCRKILPGVEFISSGYWTDANPIFLYLESGHIHRIRLAGGIDDFLKELKKDRPGIS
jgi:UDP-2,3-diacylglucosamine pyrophosphatase LpxH